MSSEAYHPGVNVVVLMLYVQAAVGTLDKEARYPTWLFPFSAAIP